ncbi:putative small secreted protein [Paenibacillus amylolyticus]|uniref:Small secreted protein n=1 Tax=Paenibacillus amylolyticus TaxID=1451 RepID=A0AAP5LT10_PAEAM|nr:hypothetical protein [Paenibacillus amylolyticus]MDR6726154.1 putative small secreted protein [Paenibacillus amylolyticus]
MNGKKIVWLSSCLLLSCALLAGCGDKESEILPADVQSAGQEISQKDAQSQIIKDKQAIIDETRYEGEELELVQLLNLSIKLRNERNETEYMKLITDDSPVGQMNTKKVTEVKIENIGDISDTQGTISAMIEMEGADSSLITYVFQKKDGEWKIYDID